MNGRCDPRGARGGRGSVVAGNWGCCWGHQTGGGEVTCDSIGGGGTGGNVYIIIIIIMVLEGVILIAIILAR